MYSAEHLPAFDANIRCTQSKRHLNKLPSGSELFRHRLGLLAILGLSILSFCSSEAAAQCIEYGDFMHQSGSLALPALAYAAATDGSVALVANSFSGLQVVDVTDPSHPILAATLDTPGEAVDVAIRGEFGFVADGQTGLLIVDLTDPYAPVVVATVDTPGVARAVCLEGDWAYVADMEAGVQVVDISDPRLASLAASFCPGFYVLDIAVGGHKAYVAANSRWSAGCRCPRSVARAIRWRGGWNLARSDCRHRRQLCLCGVRLFGRHRNRRDRQLCRVRVWYRPCTCPMTAST
jgi:hypothetical protein